MSDDLQFVALKVPTWLLEEAQRYADAMNGRRGARVTRHSILIAALMDAHERGFFIPEGQVQMTEPVIDTR